MGIFSKKRKNDILDDDTFKEPITLGNAYNIDKKLKVQHDININTMDVSIDSYKGRYTDQKYQFWNILNFHADYFQNLLQFELLGENNQELFNKILKCFRYQWLYGNCGIYKMGDRLIPVYEIKRVNDGNGEPKKIHLGLLNLIISGNELIEPKDDEWKVINADDVNYCCLYGNVNGFGAVVNWMPFIKQQTSLLKRIHTLSFILNKKLIYKIQDPAFTKKELELFLDDDLPIIFKLDGITGNVFSTEEIQGLSEGVDATITYYEFFVKIYYELLGRRMNVDYKMERNIAAEVDASQSNYNILEFDIITQRKQFLDNLAKLSGIQWKELTNATTGADESDADKSNTGDDTGKI